MEKEIFLTGVLEDVLNIKKHATKEEISRLNILTLEKSWHTGCILGQLFKSSTSERAIEIIEKRVFIDGVFKQLDVKNIFFSDELGFIEVFLFFPNANIKELYEFLRGQTDDFEPKIN